MRKIALERMLSLVPELEKHLDKIASHPGHSSVPHWTREVRGWLKKMEALLPHVGKKTAAEWQVQIDSWRAALREQAGDAE